MQTMQTILEDAAKRGDLAPENAPTYREALTAYKAYALKWYDRKPSRYLSWPGDNAKLSKGTGRPIIGLALAPANTSGIVNVCPWSTRGCRRSCLGHSAGKYAFKGKKSPRIATVARAGFMAENPAMAIALIRGEIDLAVEKYGKIAVRLNSLSDIMYEKIVPDFFMRWGDFVVFYDYTKAPVGTRKVPANYILTGSITERDNAEKIVAKLEDYGSVAVVFDTKRGQALPENYIGLPVFDGDESDRRFNDHGVIGLRAKGAAINDDTGFVRHAE